MPRLITPSLHQLSQLKMNWRVSVGALTHRLYSLRLLSEWSYRGIFIELSRYGRSREPNGIERETSQVLAKVFGSLKEAGTTKADVAKQLDLYTEDVDALVFGLTITPVVENGQRVPDASAAELRRQIKVYG